MACDSLARMLTTGQVAARLNKDAQTIRRWADEFSEFLSIHATPAKGRTRLFDEDDLGVLALAADLSTNEKASYADIRASLEAGQRGVMPDGEIAVSAGRNVAMQLDLLNAELEAAREQIQELEVRLAVSNEEIEKSRARIESLLRRIWELEQGK